MANLRVFMINLGFPSINILNKKLFNKSSSSNLMHDAQKWVMEARGRRARGQVVEYRKEENYFFPHSPHLLHFPLSPPK
jgi:hypothetical protein